MWEDDWTWIGRAEKIHGGEIEEIATKVKENQYKAGAQVWSDNDEHNYEAGPTQRWLKKDYGTSKSAVKAAQRFKAKIKPVIERHLMNVSRVERYEKPSHPDGSCVSWGQESKKIFERMDEGRKTPDRQGRDTSLSRSIDR